jgi:glycine/D-amino acid oxidase-like deaminating enzyme
MRDVRVVICGAGIAGVSAAYELAVRRGLARVVLVDERAPLTLTSDKGTQGYRNWWPGPDATMCRFVSRSIDLLEEVADASADVFRLNRRGYLFATGDPERLAALRDTALRVSRFGMGPVREHPGADRYAPAPPEEWRGQPDGADLLSGAEEVRRHFGYLTPTTLGALHVRRAGTLEVVPLGRWLLERATRAGAELVHDRVVGVRTEAGRVRAVRLASGADLAADAFVVAAGPALAEVGRMLDLELPVFHERHGKLQLDDPLGLVPRGAPFTIWTDPVRLPWHDDERARLARDTGTQRLLVPFPGGVHVRPVDRATGRELFLVWTYETGRRAPVWPPDFDPWYGEVCIRGLASMIPGFASYFGRAQEGHVDGGYYCRTRENRPLIGPLPVAGAYVLGALSGYGIMASQGAAELLGAHLTGGALPDYADAFLPSRYDDPIYFARIEHWEDGQL